MKCRMAENQELRKKMEDYVKQHDLTRLFERLATSIMYDRPGASKQTSGRRSEIILLLSSR